MDEPLLHVELLNPLVAQICKDVLWEFQFYSFDDISISAITPIINLELQQMCRCTWYNEGDNFTMHFERVFKEARILLDVEVDQLEHKGVLEQCATLRQLGMQLSNAQHPTEIQEIGQELMDAAQAVENPEVWVETFLYLNIEGEEYVEDIRRLITDDYEYWEQMGKPLVAQLIRQALDYSVEKENEMSDQQTDHSDME